MRPQNPFTPATSMLMGSRAPPLTFSERLQEASTILEVLVSKQGLWRDGLVDGGVRLLRDLRTKKWEDKGLVCAFVNTVEGKV